MNGSGCAVCNAAPQAFFVGSMKDRNKVLGVVDAGSDQPQSIDEGQSCPTLPLFAKVQNPPLAGVCGETMITDHHDEVVGHLVRMHVRDDSFETAVGVSQSLRQEDLEERNGGFTTLIDTDGFDVTGFAAMSKECSNAADGSATCDPESGNSAVTWLSEGLYR